MHYNCNIILVWLISMLAVVHSQNQQCRDLSSRCQQYKAEGRSCSSRNMQNACRRTCALCHPAAVEGSHHHGTTHTCSSGHFHCDNHHCVSPAARCNGKNDCGDWSDEGDCKNRRAPITTHHHHTKDTCRRGYFHCQNHLCKPTSVRCNGVDECGDGSDEANCPGQRSAQGHHAHHHHSCHNGYFHCNNHACKHPSVRCNDVNDCGDWSDEHNCPQN